MKHDEKKVSSLDEDFGGEEGRIKCFRNVIFERFDFFENFEKV